MTETKGEIVPKKSLVPSLAAGSRALGIVPTTFDDCYRLAQCAVAAGVVPKGHDPTAEATCMTIMYGLELGIPPMQALQGITKINGKFCIYGDLVPAVLWSKGFKLEESISGTGDDMTASCTVIRPDGAKITRTFSVANAKKAKLWNKSGPWSDYPERMLPMRARGFATKDGASDALHGLTLVEEARDIPTDDPYTAGAIKQRIAELPLPPPIPEISAVPVEPVVEPLNQAEIIKKLDADMGHVAPEQIDALQQLWKDYESQMAGQDLNPNVFEEAEAIYQKHYDRIAP